MPAHLEVGMHWMLLFLWKFVDLEGDSSLNYIMLTGPL